jgi:hypothetical protein
VMKATIVFARERAFHGLSCRSTPGTEFPARKRLRAAIGATLRSPQSEYLAGERLPSTVH